MGRVVRIFVLVLLALIPLTTLIHRDDLGRWDVQRSAMATPDELSYLLMADHFLQGGGLSLKETLGRDTFYPPGYPLLLAAWAWCVGLTAFSAHVFNALLLSAGVIAVFFFTRRLLWERAGASVIPPTEGGPGFSRNAAELLALLIAGIFAANWHVLESALLIFSEPAFMLVTFAWLGVALRWPDWPRDAAKALPVALLAVIAWSIRGAGIVCVAATILHLLLDTFRQRPLRAAILSRWGPLALAIALPACYQLLLVRFSPEKSLFFAEDSANSYSRQLLHGTFQFIEPEAGDPHPWRTVAVAWVHHFIELVKGHLYDFGESFVPWLRESPDRHFRDLIGKLFAFLGLLGWSFHAVAACRRRAASGGLLELYILLYVGLYLLWPFNMARFWSPILPIMLVYAVDAVLRGGNAVRRLPRSVLPAVLLALLLALSIEEAVLQMGNYARRLNYVSDALRDAARTVIRTSPDPGRTLVTGLGDDELYALAWYLRQEPGGAAYQVRAPDPHAAAGGLGAGGGRERADAMLLRSAGEIATEPGVRLFFFSYFSSRDAHDTLTSIRTRGGLESTRIHQKEAVASLWEIHVSPASNQAIPHTP